MTKSRTNLHALQVGPGPVENYCVRRARWAALARALIAWMQSCGRRQPVKGDWRAFNRASIAAYAVETLDRLPPPATKSIQAIKAASDRRLAAFHVLPHSKFKKAGRAPDQIPTDKNENGAVLLFTSPRREEVKGPLARPYRKMPQATGDAASLRRARVVRQPGTSQRQRA